MSDTVKIVVTVPESHTDIVLKAMGDAGAGRIGNYSHCTFTIKGVGKFLPLEGAHPTIGEVGKFEEVREDRVETVCKKDILEKVIEAIKKVHPYEELAIDIYPLEDL